jgi:hypothetical protein
MGMPGDSVQFRGATCAYSGTVGAGRGSMSGPVTCADTYSKRSYTVHGYWSAAIEP